MSTPELDDLGRRIEACMKKHGYTPEMIAASRRRLVFVKLALSYEKLSAAMAQSSFILSMSTAAIEHANRNSRRRDNA